jgi:sugar-phosphatase
MSGLTGRPRLGVTARALLVDLDGTLVDSHGSIERAWARWCAQRGADLVRVLQIMPGRPARSVFAEVAPGLSPDEAAADADRLLSWQVEDTDGVLPLPGAAELLAALPPACWAVVTSGNRALARARLRAAGLPLPGTLVTTEDVRTGKPDPESYLLAASRLGVRPADCVVLEDAPAGVAAGRAAGMAVLAIGGSVPRPELVGATWWVPALDTVRVWVDAGWVTLSAA